MTRKQKKTKFEVFFNSQDGAKEKFEIEFYWGILSFPVFKKSFIAYPFNMRLPNLKSQIQRASLRLRGIETFQSDTRTIQFGKFSTV